MPRNAALLSCRHALVCMGRASSVRTCEGGGAGIDSGEGGRTSDAATKATRVPARLGTSLDPARLSSTLFIHLTSPAAGHSLLLLLLSAAVVDFNIFLLLLTPFAHAKSPPLQLSNAVTCTVCLRRGCEWLAAHSSSSPSASTSPRPFCSLRYALPPAAASLASDLGTLPFAV